MHGREANIFLYYINKYKSVKNDNASLENAKKIFSNIANIIYVFVEESINEDTAMFYKERRNVSGEQIKSFICQRNLLRKKDINSYLIRIPDLQDIDDTLRHPEWGIGSWLYKILWSDINKEQMEKNLNNLTELSYDDAKKAILNRKQPEKVFGKGTKTIYLVGPCIVEGGGNLYGEDVVSILYNKLIDLGLDYTVIRMPIPAGGWGNNNLKFPIRCCHYI